MLGVLQREQQGVLLLLHIANRCVSHDSLIDSIQCCTLEAVVLLMDAGDAEESSNAACQTSSEDLCVKDNQTM